MKFIDRLLASHPNHKLENWVDLARSFGVDHANPHRAADDAMATGGVLLKALTTARELGLAELGDLYRLDELTSDDSADDSDLTANAAES